MGRKGKSQERWKSWNLKSDGDRLRREQMVSAFCPRPSILRNDYKEKEREKKRERAGGKRT